MPGNNNYYGNQDHENQDQGQGRDHSQNSDNRQGGSNCSRSQYRDDNRSLGDSHSHRSGSHDGPGSSLQQREREYDCRKVDNQRQVQYWQASSGTPYRPQGNDPWSGFHEGRGLSLPPRRGDPWIVGDWGQGPSSSPYGPQGGDPHSGSHYGQGRGRGSSLPPRRGEYDPGMVEIHTRQGQHWRDSGGSPYGPQGNGPQSRYSQGHHHNNLSVDVDTTYDRRWHHDHKQAKPPRNGRYLHGRGGGVSGRRRNPGQDLSDLRAIKSNLAEVTEGFVFYEYSIVAQNSIDNEPIKRQTRTRFFFNLGFWEGLGLLKDLPDKEKNEFRTVVFFNGLTFYSGQPIPGIEDNSKLPYKMNLGDRGQGDTMEIKTVRKLLAQAELQVPRSEHNPNELAFDNRIANETRWFKDHKALFQHCRQTSNRPAYIPSDGELATVKEFSAFVDSALKSALSTKFLRWGHDLINPDFGPKNEPYLNATGEPLTVSVYQAYWCKFGDLKKTDGKAVLTLTVDLRAKVIPKESVLESLVGRRDAKSWNPSEEEMKLAKERWRGEIVIAKHDKNTYTVMDLDFENSAESLVINHVEYFKQRRNIQLNHPKFKPMVTALNHRGKLVHLPAERICGNEMDSCIKRELPKIASFPPHIRNNAVELVQEQLVPGKKDSILAGLGIQITDQRLSSKATVLPIPMVIANGIPVPGRKGAWAPHVNKHCNYDIDRNRSNTFNVVLIYNNALKKRAAKYVLKNLYGCEQVQHSLLFE